VPKCEEKVLLGAPIGKAKMLGGFSNKPPGGWVIVKLFLLKGGDDGEVFLNTNPLLGKGEFSTKDERYGDFVVQELGRVL